MRKAQATSRLKNLPDEVQDRIADWCQQGTLSTAVLRCARELTPPVLTSAAAMGRFFQWWKLRQLFRQVNAETEEATELLRAEFPKATPEKIAAAGQFLFTLRARHAASTEDFVLLEKLRLAQRVAEENAQIARARLQQNERQLAQKDADLKLAGAKFRRDTAALFLEWYDKEEAKRIAAGAGTNTEKIEALGRAMFGEDWEQP